LRGGWENGFAVFVLHANVHVQGASEQFFSRKRSFVWKGKGIPARLIGDSSSLDDVGKPADSDRLPVGHQRRKIAADEAAVNGKLV
jgi:hypothetical protein